MTNTTPQFSAAALAGIAETSADWRADLAALRSGAIDSNELLTRCLDGADLDRHDGWRDYVAAIVDEVSP